MKHKFVMLVVSLFIFSTQGAHTASAVQDRWKFLKNQDEIEIYQRNFPGSNLKEFKGIMYVKGVRLSSMVATFDDTRSYTRWMHNCTETKLLKYLNVHERLTYTVTHVPWPASDRDTVVYSLMSQKPDDKTIAFAMKIFDLVHKAETGRYVRFPASIPIPADLRIGRVTLACGLIDIPPGKQISNEMESIEKLLNKEKGRILAAWARVSDAAGGLSLFRIDSLVWQVGEPIFKYRRAPETAKKTISRILEGYSCPTDISKLVGDALSGQSA